MLRGSKEMLHIARFQIVAFLLFYRFLFSPFPLLYRRGTARTDEQHLRGFHSYRSYRPVTDAQMTGSPTSVSHKCLNAVFSLHAKVSSILHSVHHFIWKKYLTPLLRSHRVVDLHASPSPTSSDVMMGCGDALQLLEQIHAK